MNTASLPYRYYGAFELKRAYQQNLGRGICWAAAFHLMLIAAVLMVQYVQSRTIADPAVAPIVFKPITDIAPPPSVTHTRPLPTIATPDVALPVIGIPTPVPDEQVTEQVRFPTRDELAVFNTPVPTDGVEGNYTVSDIPQGDEYFPPPDEFVAVQEMPVMVKEEIPTYPDVALLTNREATVWIKALVDKEGKVREVRIAKSSGMNVGFDEAALTAAYHNIYKPAIQNGKPVAIWVTYPVEFKLR